MGKEPLYNLYYYKLKRYYKLVYIRLNHSDPRIYNIRLIVYKLVYSGLNDNNFRINNISLIVYTD